MARKQEPEGGGDSWMNTYADMVTLLMTFFVVMLSMSTIDQNKFNAFVQSFTSLPENVIEDIIGQDGGVEEGEAPIEGDVEELYQMLKDYVDDNEMGYAIDIAKVEDVVFIRFNSVLFFAPNSYTLLADSYPTLDFVGEALTANQDAIRTINILGHTASTDDSLNTLSWILSGERAGIVAKFIDDWGFEAKKLVAMGYGKNFPIAPNDNEEGMSQNRRVELVIVGIDSDLSYNTYEGLQDFFNDSQYPSSGNAAELFTPADGSAVTNTPEASSGGGIDIGGLEGALAEAGTPSLPEVESVLPDATQ